MIDLLLILVALVLVGVGALLLWLSPDWWAWYVSALDIRIWSLWKCVVLAVILWESLILIRHWPNKKHQHQVNDKPSGE